MAVHANANSDSSVWGPRLSVGQEAGMPVVTLTGLIDRELAGRADPLLQLTTFEHEGPVAIDVSAVDAMTGALIGVLLRASRRLAWRNRQLIILCRDPQNLRALEIAGLDELATIRVSGRTAG
jgi:anti-anti-sigma factor